jgi:hypothetical protein
MFSVPRLPRGPWKVRPRARRGAAALRAFSPALLPLEERQLLSSAADLFAPTDAEQAMLEMVNRARANPAAEGQRLVALAQTDPVLRAATSGEDLNQFLRVISSFSPEPPLALDTRLIEAARDHDAAMLAVNTQFHAPLNYLTNAQTAHAYDGQAYYPSGNSWWSTGENIFAYSHNVTGSNVTDYVNYFEDAFLLDWGNPDFGHLMNLLAPGPSQWNPSMVHYPYSEIGIGLLTGVTPTVPPGANNSIAVNQGLNVGPDLVTQEFGWHSGTAFLTGTFYVDSANTGFYAPGEGLGGVTIRAVGRGGQGVFTAQTWSSGGYSLQLPAGTYDVTASGNLPYTMATTVTIGTDNLLWEYGFKTIQADQPVPGDYNGSGRDEVAVYRAASGQWFLDGQSAPTNFGGAGVDLPLPGNYDGVSHTEMALYRPSTGQWFLLGPSGGRFLGTFGAANLDMPVPGNYNGLGRTEPAVFRPTSATWFINGPTGYSQMAFGAPNLDIPVPGDYDGVGHTEPAVYRPTTSEWFVMGPSGGRRIGSFGQPNVDIPVPGDYDGVGHAELAVYRPTTGQWFIQGPNGTRTINFGEPNLDVPLKGNFDGNGIMDPVLFRPTTGQWFIMHQNEVVETRRFGQGGSSTPISGWLNAYAAHPSPRITHDYLVPLQAFGTAAAVSFGGSLPRAETVGSLKTAPAIAHTADQRAAVVRIVGSFRRHRHGKLSAATVDFVSELSA